MQEQADLFVKMGFDALFFARLDYRDKLKRKEEKSLEMLWKTSHDDSSLFTGAFVNDNFLPLTHIIIVNFRCSVQ